MRVENIMSSIYEALAKQGFKGKIVPIKHVDELQTEIEIHFQKGHLNGNLYADYLANFDFKLVGDFPEANSLIIVTAPQPQVRCLFRWRGRVYPCIIPPTYSSATDNQISDCLEKILKPEGFHQEIKKLPQKLLAVRSGLAQYGKNNITYVPGMGSFHRPAVFVSDLPCVKDNWRESSTLKTCDGCTACRDACPAGAISSDRFLLYAERCLTFHNERRGMFPHWLDSYWHNCLAGCMYCQKACPMNQRFINRVEDGMTFDEHETAFLLEDTPKDDLPGRTIVKLAKLDMMEYAAVLGRNLKVLIEAQHQWKK
jgi:epoxyqueuosine reductase